MSDFDVSSSPSRPRREEPPWIMLWLTIFSSVVLANLVAVFISFLVARAYVNHKVDEFKRTLPEAFHERKQR